MSSDEVTGQRMTRRERKDLRQQILRLVNDRRNFTARTVIVALRQRGVTTSQAIIRCEVKNLRHEGAIVPVCSCSYPDGAPGWFTIAKEDGDE